MKIFLIIGVCLGVLLIGFGLWLLLPIHKSNVRNLAPQGDQSSSSTATAQLADCVGTQLLTTLPIAADHIAAVTPLGNINSAGGHVSPSDHIGIGLTSRTLNASTTPPNRGGDNRPGDQQVKAAPDPTDLLAPAEVVITKIHYQTSSVNGPANTDYSLIFSPCKQVTFYFNHVPQLSSALLAQVSAVTNPHCQGDNQNKFCDYDVSYTAKAGEVLGSVGGGSEQAVGFDFGEYDTRTTPLPYLDTALEKSELADEIYHSGCPLDYYPTILKNQLLPLLGRPGQPRTVEPRCGSIIQDQTGTIQGNWYIQGSGYTTWATNLAIVHDNIDPTIGIISIGGTITTAGSQRFTPTTTGTINREPNQTTIGQLYCYTRALTNPVMGLDGQTLVELSDPQTMKVEHQVGDCTGALSFQKPTIYSRISTEGQSSPGSAPGPSQSSQNPSAQPTTSQMNDSPQACSTTIPVSQQPPGCQPTQN